MMKMAKRNTIQRQLVIAAVRFLADHPTAEEVYDRITMEYPDISKGTVYRNLNSLVESGLLSKVSVPSVLIVLIISSQDITTSNALNAVSS
jgi:Fur family peroxide stress response transcriptional regulator